MPAVIYHTNHFKQGGYIDGNIYLGRGLYRNSHTKFTPRRGNGISGVFSKITSYFKPKSELEKAVSSVASAVNTGLGKITTNKDLLKQGLKAINSGMNLSSSIADAVKTKHTADAIANQKQLEQQRIDQARQRPIIQDKMDDTTFNKIKTGEGLKPRRTRINKI